LRIYTRVRGVSVVIETSVLEAIAVSEDRRIPVERVQIIYKIPPKNHSQSDGSNKNKGMSETHSIGHTGFDEGEATLCPETATRRTCSVLIVER
jgi:hypothetical protein